VVPNSDQILQTNCYKRVTAVWKRGEIRAKSRLHV